MGNVPATTLFEYRVLISEPNALKFLIGSKYAN
jgi:hypothetical protein